MRWNQVEDGKDIQLQENQTITNKFNKFQIHSHCLVYLLNNCHEFKLICSFQMVPGCWAAFGLLGYKGTCVTYFCRTVSFLLK